MARTLTPKQAAYRDARVSGLGPSDAYRKAYDAANMSPKAISVAAARLEKHASIGLAIVRASTATAERAIVTQEMVLRGLLEIAQNSDAPHSARRAAWRDLGEFLRMFKLVVDLNMVASIAEEMGLDPAEVQREAESILRTAK